MDHQKLEKAIEMAKNDAKILANPSSKLYPILIRKLNYLVSNPAKKSQELKENTPELKPLELKPALKSKSKSPAPLSRQQKLPLQPKPVADNARARVKVVESIIKPTASVSHSPRQSSMLKSPKKPPQPPALYAHQTKKHLIPQLSNLSHDFVVPKLDSPNPTRTGLVQKSKKSDLESMRQESDDRLKIAMKHLITARKKALAEEKLKKAKLNKYSKVKSKVGSTQWNLKKSVGSKVEIKEVKSSSVGQEVPKRWDLSQEFPESPTNVSNVGKIQDISMIQHIYDEKSALGHIDNADVTAEIHSKSGISTEQGTPYANNNRLQSKSIAEINNSPKPIKPAFKSSSSNNVNTDAKLPKSKSSLKVASSTNLGTPKANLKPPKPISKSSNTSALNSKAKVDNIKSTSETDQLIQSVLHALETKLDPMLAKVQQQWENASAHIDEKIAHALERHDEVAQEPLLIDMEEPSILVESETHFFQVTNAKAELPEPVQQEHSIYHDEGDDAILIQNEIKFIEKEYVLAPYQRTVLALPAYLIEDIIQDQTRKQKWREMYYGAEFDSASAIERIGKELFDEMIDTVVSEIEGVSNEYLGALLQSEIF